MALLDFGEIINHFLFMLLDSLILWAIRVLGSSLFLTPHKVFLYIGTISPIIQSKILLPPYTQMLISCLVLFFRGFSIVWKQVLMRQVDIEGESNILRSIMTPVRKADSETGMMMGLVNFQVAKYMSTVTSATFVLHNRKFSQKLETDMPQLTSKGIFSSWSLCV